MASSRKSTVMVRLSRVWRVVLRMGHPLGRWSLQMMTQDGGKTAQLQGDHEGFRDSTTKLGGMWEIGVGEEFVQKIERGLEEAQFVIVLLTKASVASEWV